jgi:hypothetical protein
MASGEFGELDQIKDLMSGIGFPTLSVFGKSRSRPGRSVRDFRPQGFHRLYKSRTQVSGHTTTSCVRTTSAYDFFKSSSTLGPTRSFHSYPELVPTPSSSRTSASFGLRGRKEQLASPTRAPSLHRTQSATS